MQLSVGVSRSDLEITKVGNESERFAILLTMLQI
jgi:hypothetical protein